jgi:adenylylsulfate kinase
MAQETGFTVWLTGMLGAGKTTLAQYVEARLRQVGRKVEILDEDELQEELWKELEGATKDERMTIARRLGFVADALTRNGVATLVACASPDKQSRDENRRRIQRYIEVYVDCPTDELIKRDTTGKYKKALAGEIPNFVGITEPYQPPSSAEVIVHTNTESIEDGGLKVFQSLLDLSYMTTEELKVITGTKMKANPNPKKVKPGKPPKPAKAAKPAKPAKAAKAPKAAKAGKKKKK